MAQGTTSFTWTTTLSVEQVRDALAQRVQPGKLLAFELGDADTGRPFRGEVGDAGFRIIRRGVWRNTFVPVLTGVVRAEGTGAQVDVRLALPGAVIGFIVAWTAIAVGAAAWLVLSLPPEVAMLPALAILPMPIVGPLIGWLMFNAEARRAMKLLREWLPAPSSGDAAPDAAPPR